jgi:hypothetical protein
MRPSTRSGLARDAMLTIRRVTMLTLEMAGQVDQQRGHSGDTASRELTGAEEALAWCLAYSRYRRAVSDRARYVASSPMCRAMSELVWCCVYVCLLRRSGGDVLLSRGDGGIWTQNWSLSDPARAAAGFLGYRRPRQDGV